MRRRFTVRGASGGVTVVDDYGHHPVEIEATLSAADEAFEIESDCCVSAAPILEVHDLYDEFCH